MFRAFKRYIALSLCILSAVAIRAQYEQDINVEGKYVPEFIPRDRIGAFPVPMHPEVAKSSLAFELQGVNADFIPQAIPVPATGWRTYRSLPGYRGYLDLGAGSWLQSTLSAGYRFVDDASTTAGISLQHNSSSLWKPDLAPMVADVKMQRYDESVSAFASHLFDGAGRLDAALDYHLGYFNYYGFNPLPAAQLQPGDKALDAPTQTLNEVAFRLGWKSDGLSSLSYHAALDARHFAYRRFYGADTAPAFLASFRGAAESELSLLAGVRWAPSSSSSLGLDFKAGGRFYSAPKLLEYGGAENYADLSLRPYYAFNADRFSARIGAVLDLAMNARNEAGERYRTFNAAPDVRLDYAGSIFSLFLHVTGGNEYNTLASNRQADYYSTPALFSTLPSYTPADARIGFAFRTGGFHAGIDAAYKVTFNQTMPGWYGATLNGATFIESIAVPAQYAGASLFPSLDMRYTIRGFSLGLDAGYDAGRWFKLDARGTLQPQDGRKGYYNGMDRPKYTVNAAVESNPWNTLKFRLAFDLRACRAFPFLAETVNPLLPELSKTEVLMHKVSNWASLNFGATYDFTDNFGIWLQADNLTNRSNVLAPGLPLPGITVTGGISLQF